MSRTALVLVLALAPAASAADPPRVDWYGDPLPPGAIARLGSTHLQTDSPRVRWFAPDGKTFHGPVHGPAWAQWDVATGKRLKLVVLASEYLTTPRVSADGSTALVYGRRGDWRFVEVATGTFLTATVKGYKESYDDHDPFSPDGRYFATTVELDAPGEDRKVLRLWETRTGKSWVLGKCEWWPYCSLRFSPDGNRLVVAVSNELTCWSVPDRKQLWRSDLKPERMIPKGPFFSPDGKWIATDQSGSQPHSSVAVWETATGTTPAFLKINTSLKNTPHTFSANSQELLVWHSDGDKPQLRWWNLRDGTSRPQEGKVDHWLATPSPDGKRILTRDENQLQIIDLPSGKPLWPDMRNRRHFNGMSDLAFDTTSTRVFTIGGDDTIRVWNARDGKPLRTVAAKNLHAYHFAFTADGRRCVVPTADEETYSLTVFDTETWRYERGFSIRRVDFDDVGRPHVSRDGTIRQARLSELQDKDGGTIGAKGELLSWNLATGLAGPRRELPPTAYGSRPHDTFSPDGRLVASRTNVCDATTGHLLFPLVAKDEPESDSVSFSADGRLISALVEVARNENSPDREGPTHAVTVRDTLTGKIVASLSAGWDSQHKLTADGRRLVSADGDGFTVRDVASGKQLLHHKSDPQLPRGHSQSPLIALSPDGQLAVVAEEYSSGNALIYDLTKAEVVKTTPPSRFDLLAAWVALGDPKTARPLSLMWRLVDHPDRSVPFLRDRILAVVKPFRVPNEADIRSAVTDLDDAEFATREAAEKTLGALGETARGILLDALRKTKSPEQRARLSRLLTRLDAAPVAPLAREEVALSWALGVLERIGTPEARDAIRHMASGAPASRLTREANAAHYRLTVR